MEIRKIVLTGGPCSGKTTALSRIQTEFKNRGYRVLIGRNNLQNDRLSLKTACGSDLWLHTQKIPGSHVIVCAEGREIPPTTIEQAAVLAAYHSKARESAQVPVDYTFARHLKKPVGAKPGKVIYHVYSTLIVNPDRAQAEALRVPENG